MPSAEPTTVDGNRRLPLGFTREEESLYMDGLTQTCSALRRRIAELEADNRVLQQEASKALAAVAAANSAGVSASSAGTSLHTSASTTRTSSCTQQQEPKILEGKLSSVLTVQGGRKCYDVGNGANGSNHVRSPRHGGRGSTPGGINAPGFSDENGEATCVYSPRILGSLPYDKQQRFSGSITRKGGSVLPSSHEDDDRMSLTSPSVGGVVVGGGGVVAKREGGVERDVGESGRGWATGCSEVRPTPPKQRRVSAVPNRTRYSVGVSRFSLPPSMSPNMSPSKSNDGDGSTSPFAQRQQGAGVWEGLTLKHPLTRREEELTFMEFAVVGIGQAVLSGAQAVRDWGQATEVISRFPCTSGDGCGSPIDSGGGGRRREKPEDVVFVDGLEDFCFPSGAAIALVEGGSGMLDVFSEDRIHLVQFTDCENTSTYGCCLTVTHVLQDPSPRLIKRLRDREKTHTAARTLQRFMRRACDLRRARRAQGANDTLPISAVTAAAAPAATYAGDSPPTSLSLMINRFFASNQGIDSAAASSADRIANADTTDGGIDAARRRGTSGEWSSPAPTAQSRAREASTALSPATSSTTAAGSSPFPYPRTGPSPSNTESRESRSRAGEGARVGSKPHDASDSAAVWDSNGGGGNDDDDDVGVLGSAPGKPSRTVPATVPGNIRGNTPGTFSDDESESDAGHSTDHESGSGLEGAMITERTRSVAMGGGGIVRRHVSSGVGNGENEGIPSALLRPTTQASSRTPPRRRTRTAKCGPADGGHSRSWHVLVERCYAMVSCHRNHSLMFKVLKAAADADRSTRPGSTTPSSTPPHMRAGSPGAITPDATTPTPPGLPERRGAALVGGAEEEGVGGRGAGTKENPRAASRFRSVAAAAAEEAKGRHRRMLRDKFLHQVRTDKAAIGEHKKVSVHCPAFLRAPLEVTAVPLELWATAVLFASLPEESIVRSLDVLLLEKTLAVCGRDLDMVSMVTTALLSLLEPLKWEGVFVPVVPEKLMDVLGSPVPALVGIQAPLNPVHRHDFDGVAVLDLDSKATHQLFMGGMEERLPVSESLLKALENANTLAGRGRGARTPTSRSPVKDGSHHSIREGSNHRRVYSPKDDVKASGGVTKMGGRKTTTSPGPRSQFAFQASTFMGGMTADEKGTVLRLRSLVKAHVSSFCGDLHIPGNWRKYGEFSAASGEFEFCPDWFTGPLEARMKFQAGVAHTQMFVSFVDRCRIGDAGAKAEALNAQHAAAQRRPSVSPSSPGTTCHHTTTHQHQQRGPAAQELEDNQEDDGNRQGKAEAIPAQFCNTCTPSRGASVESSSGATAAGLSPPPLPCRRLPANLSDGAAFVATRRGSGGGRLGASVVSPPPLPTRR